MKIKLLKFSVFVIIIFISLSACKKASDLNTAVADVFVRSIISDGEPVYGLAQYVSGSSAISSVTVHTPDGLTDQLNAYDSNNTTFYSEPLIALGTYYHTHPVPGEYSYGVTFSNGNEQVVKNTLTAGYLLPADIVSCAKTTDGLYLRTTWSPLLSANAYRFVITKAGSVVFTSEYFEYPTTGHKDLGMSNLYSFTPGTFTLELEAILVESTDNSLLQAVSSASISVDL